jgi:hypothetical protein
MSPTSACPRRAWWCLTSASRSSYPTSRKSPEGARVLLDDPIAGGALNVDAEVTGTMLRDSMRNGELEPLPEDLVAAYAPPVDRTVPTATVR